MKGVKWFEDYYLIILVIYLCEGVYGCMDFGQMGIDNFFVNYQCNNFCWDFFRLDEFGCFLKDCDLDFVVFQLESVGGIFIKKMKLNIFVIFRIGFIVYCNKFSYCVCEFFCLFCLYRIEYMLGLIYVINCLFV